MGNGLLILGVMILVEAIGIFLSFGLGVVSVNGHRSLMKVTGMKKCLHFHHVYLIIPAIILYFLGLEVWGDILTGIALSDLLHHIILKIFTGSSEFNIFYKKK